MFGGKGMKTIVFGCGKGFEDLVKNKPNLNIIAIADNNIRGGERK